MWYACSSEVFTVQYIDENFRVERKHTLYIHTCAVLILKGRLSEMHAHIVHAIFSSLLIFHTCFIIYDENWNECSSTKGRIMMFFFVTTYIRNVCPFLMFVNEYKGWCMKKSLSSVRVHICTGDIHTKKRWDFSSTEVRVLVNLENW